jgi:hypothetical protein
LSTAAGPGCKMGSATCCWIGRLTAFTWATPLVFWRPLETKQACGGTKLYHTTRIQYSPPQTRLGRGALHVADGGGWQFLAIDCRPMCTCHQVPQPGYSSTIKGYLRMKSRATLVREGNVIIITVTASTQKGAGLAQSMGCNLDTSFDFQQRPAILLWCYCPSCEDVFCFDQQMHSELTFLLRCCRNIRATNSVSVWHTGEFIYWLHRLQHTPSMYVLVLVYSEQLVICGNKLMHPWIHT